MNRVSNLFLRLIRLL